MTSAPSDIFEFCTYVAPGREEDYERFHRAIPADLDRAMRAAGVLGWRIYRNATRLTHVVEARDRAAMQAQLDGDPVNLRWQQQVAPFLGPGDGAAPGATGPGTLIWDMSWPTR
jgi:L-rhamnose mutarotase